MAIRVLTLEDLRSFIAKCGALPGRLPIIIDLGDSTTTVWAVEPRLWDGNQVLTRDVQESTPDNSLTFFTTL